MDDLISRQALCKYALNQKDKSVTPNDIMRFPSAQPKRKIGHWIEYYKSFPWSRHYKCSECGNYLDFSGVNAGRGSANYCPNCGADMRGERNERTD